MRTALRRKTVDDIFELKLAEAHRSFNERHAMTAVAAAKMPARGSRQAALAWRYGTRVAPLFLLALGLLWPSISYSRKDSGGAGGGSTAELSDLAAVAAAEAAAARALAGEAPTLHGQVQKVGMLPESRWHPRYNDYINHKWGLWMRKRRRLELSTWPSTLSPHVYPGCAVLANHAYRFIFVRHPKCASSALLHHFTLCSESRATRSCLEPWNGSKLSSVANASSADIEAMWRDYFVFTIVRNPLSRAVSSYKFVLSATVANEECANRMDWDSFCAHPLLAGELCRLRPRCCPFGPLFAWSHVIDQARCMTTMEGGMAVDYVARMERLDEDAAEIFRQINARRPEGLPPLEMPPQIKKVLPSNTGALTEGSQEGGGSCAGAEAAPKQHHAADGPAYFFAVPGNFTSVVAKESSYCGLRDFFSGPHKHCLPSIRRAYGADLRLLYAESEEEAGDEGPVDAGPQAAGAAAAQQQATGGGADRPAESDAAAAAVSEQEGTASEEQRNVAASSRRRRGARRRGLV